MLQLTTLDQNNFKGAKVSSRMSENKLRAKSWKVGSQWNLAVSTECFLHTGNGVCDVARFSIEFV